jgi:hypothetical protein
MSIQLAGTGGELGVSREGQWAGMAMKVGVMEHVFFFLFFNVILILMLLLLLLILFVLFF